MKKSIVLFVLLGWISGIYAGYPSYTSIEKQTFIYSIKGEDTLRLDKYNIPAGKVQKACVIFLFGGGFSSGQRDSENYVPYFHWLAENEYTVISIDYRLGFKKTMGPSNTNSEDPVKALKGINIRNFIGLFENTVSMAVEDLFDATSFVVSQADNWNINKNEIISCGSSAGAVTVLQAEYFICNEHELTKKLPENFKYAGAISFAGAILSKTENLEWKSPPAPLLLFHGDADSNVPYDHIGIFGAGLFGSKFIAAQLDKLNSPYYFYTAENTAHEMAWLPMTQNRDEINIFLNKFVKEKKRLIINTSEKQTDKPEINKKFDIRDFINSNFK